MTDLKRFEYVLALEECRNFSQAAAKLGISQSSLSQYIQKMERELGVVLFDRTSSNLQLTQYGDIFTQNARKILEIYAQTVDTINDANSGLSGVIRVGLSPSRAPFLLPSVIKEFRKEFPAVTLKVVGSKSKNIIKNLNDGVIDFAYTVTTDLENNSDLVVKSLADEEIMLVCSKQSVISKYIKNGTVENDILKDIPFIILEDDQLLTSYFYKLCKNSAICGNASISVSEISTAVSLVQNNLGVMLLPSSYKNYGDLCDNFNFFSLKQHLSSRKIAILYKKDKYINRPTQRLMDVFERYTLKNF